jgi:alpha-glucosidase
MTVIASSRAARYVREDELHQVFNFNFMMIRWNATAMRASIEQTLSELVDVKAPATWVLNNHDTPRVVTRIGSPVIARALAMLTHSLPGGIYIYQGEELGLPSADLPDEAREDPAFIRSGGTDKGRDEARVPIPWSSTLPNYGFAVATPWLPQPKDWAQYAIDVETKDPMSSWTLYKKSLALRHSHPALGGEGVITWIDASPGLLHFTREPGLEVVVNTNGGATTLPVFGSSVLLESIGGNLLQDGQLTIAANTTVWLQR